MRRRGGKDGKEEEEKRELEKWISMYKHLLLLQKNSLIISLHIWQFTTTYNFSCK